MTRRVVVTGLGLVTPLGAGVETSWKNLLAGQSGIVAIDRFDASDLPCRIAGQVNTDNPDQPHYVDLDSAVDAKMQKHNDRFIQLGIMAGKEAIEDAGITDLDEATKDRAGILMGSGIGGLGTLADGQSTLDHRGPRRISPFFIPAALINLLSGQLSIRYGLRGPNSAVVTACSTGVHAIGDAARMIMLDDADIMVAGSAEAPITKLGMAGFCSARAMSTGYNDTPSKASRPYDVDRDGFVMGEGAGAVVLEELEHAKRRGATIYGEVVGYGLSGDAFHITRPPDDGNGGYRAMAAAMKRSGLDFSDIDYINTHGTSTPAGDEVEVDGIRRLFGDAIKDLSISSTKSAIGHLLGGAGSVEAIFCALAMRDQIVPPTLNLDRASDSVADLDLVPHTAKERPVKAILSNSFGFGGTNACLVMKSADGL